jgi:hypothetical protein
LHGHGEYIWALHPAHNGGAIGGGCPSGGNETTIDAGQCSSVSSGLSPGFLDQAQAEFAHPNG